jgi:DNA polymerase-1
MVGVGFYLTFPIKELCMTALAIDTETTGTNFLFGAMPFLVTACDDAGNTYYWEFKVDPVNREVYKDPIQIKDMLDVFNSYDDWVFHNANFDLRALSVLTDIPIDEIHNLRYDPTIFWDHIHDTLIQSHIIDSYESHKLKDLALRYLDISKEDEQALQEAVVGSRRLARKYKDTICKGWDIDGDTVADYWLPRAMWECSKEAPIEWEDVCLTYALRDVERTIMLHAVLYPQIESMKATGSYYREIRLLETILHIQNHGMTFRMPFAIQELKAMVQELHDLQRDMKRTAKIYKIEDLNIDSPKQLNELIYTKMGYPVLSRTESGQPSVSADAIEDLINDDSHLDLDDKKFLLNLREYKLVSTSKKYVSNYMQYALPYNTYVNRKGIYSYRIHPNLNQTGTSTTRFSSSNPNGQNISTGHEEDDGSGGRVKRLNLRELFGPPPGCVWYSIDYSSLQLIIFAYEANDEGMINAFLNGYDFHNYVACGLFNTQTPTKDQRRIAKNVNYALIFGAGANKVDATAGMFGAYELYQQQFPIVGEYMNRITHQVRRTGYVRTKFGYPLRVPIDHPYKGVNYIVQGDEGDIVKNAMMLCHNFLKTHSSGARLIMQIHDELVFECSKFKDFPLEEICKSMMEPARKVGWHTPVGASIVHRHWGDKQDVSVSF